MKLRTWLIAATATLILLYPYFLGHQRFNDVVGVVQNLMGNDQFTDSDIESVLIVFDFNIDANSNPEFIDYYTSGLKAIF